MVASKVELEISFGVRGAASDSRMMSYGVQGGAMQCVEVTKEQAEAMRDLGPKDTTVASGEDYSVCLDGKPFNVEGGPASVAMGIIDAAQETAKERQQVQEDLGYGKADTHATTAAAAASTGAKEKGSTPLTDAAQAHEATSKPAAAAAAA